MSSSKNDEAYKRMMDEQIDGMAKEYHRKFNREQTHQKEYESEYNVPKFPIEKEAMKSHMVELISYTDPDDEKNFDCDNVTEGLWTNKNEGNSINSCGGSLSINGAREHHQSINSGIESTGSNHDAPSSLDCSVETGRPPCHWYHKISISGEKEATLASEEVEDKKSGLITAIRLRKKYMEISSQDFCRTTERYLDLLDTSQNPATLDDNTDYYLQPPRVNPNLSFNVPSTKSNPFKVAHIPVKMDGVKLVWEAGLVKVVKEDNNEVCYESKISYLEHVRDYQALSVFVSDGPLISFCYRRLSFLNYRFKMHTLMNEWHESAEQKSVPHRDFYNIHKVDTHIHASSAMNQKHLLRFIKRCLKTRKTEKVLLDRFTDKVMTLEEVFSYLNITPQDLTIDKLNVHCDRDTFHRFDKFNAKYNPLGQSELREIFLKTDNYSKGKLFAEVLKEVMEDLEDSKYQCAEFRLSIYGRSPDEWDKLAKWALDNAMYSDHVKWMIQFPRIYDIFKAKGLVNNFQQIIENIFTPLFEVTIDPSSHPELFRFLWHISGFDSVDDESKPEPYNMEPNTPNPEQWVNDENPPYSYYLFYTFANIATLNRLRLDRGLPILKFRPHCGEAGYIQHLVSGFLLAESINHGLLLRKAPVLQYLYYLCQVGLAMSPLSNNSLFLDYNRSPLYDYFCRGLNVSLSTDDPLQFHHTKEPLMEEYSIAAQVWKLSNTDTCELVRNSVLLSGFSDKVKSHWLGNDFKEEGCRGNDMTRSNVPNIRTAYRFESLICELNLILKMTMHSKQHESINNQ